MSSCPTSEWHRGGEGLWSATAIGSPLAFIAAPRSGRSYGLRGAGSVWRLAQSTGRASKARQISASVEGADGTASGEQRLQKENERLRRAVADLTLDEQILAEAARGNS